MREEFYLKHAEVTLRNPRLHKLLLRDQHGVQSPQVRSPAAAITSLQPSASHSLLSSDRHISGTTVLNSSLGFCDFCHCFLELVFIIPNVNLFIWLC